MRSLDVLNIYFKPTEMEKLKAVKVTFANGEEITTSISATTMDEDIHLYFGKDEIFNLGHGDLDNLQKVTSCEILKT